MIAIQLAKATLSYILTTLGEERRVEDLPNLKLWRLKRISWGRISRNLFLDQEEVPSKTKKKRVETHHQSFCQSSIGDDRVAFEKIQMKFYGL
jgi:hypothetical protein